MKKLKKKNIFRIPSNNLIFIYGLITVITIIGLSLIIPTIMNYPPGSINNSFDTQKSYIPYYMQFILGIIVGLIFISIIIKILFTDIDKWYRLPESRKYTDKQLVKNIRKKCLMLPYLLFIIEAFFPIAITFIIFFSTGGHILLLFMKLCVLLFSAGLIIAVIFYICSKKLYTQVLSDTFRKNDDIGPRIGLRAKMFLQLLPVIIVCIIMTSLIGYSKQTAEKNDLMFEFYSKQLNLNFQKENVYSEQEIIATLNSLILNPNDSFAFIIYPDQTTYSSNNKPLSNFIIDYTLQLSENYNGRTYENYGLDSSGATIKLKTEKGIVYAGIMYTSNSNDIVLYYSVNALILLGLAIIILQLFTKSHINDLHFITSKFKDIYKTSNIQMLGELPIISNDEIGDLSYAFNKIQVLTKENIESIHDKQDMLVEKERLASLGQMIGGIAHNLKTPIMSISGAAEGLSDLIKEYDNSIEDKDVTPQDHHEIAAEMSGWIDKIRIHTEYMSDVITAVKGQAVKLSDEQIESFTIEDLLKHVTILMKHELKNALTDLNVEANIDTSVELYGNINILVQVINNIISNAIQAYNGEPNKTIDFEVNEIGAYIVFKIRDYADGIKPEVQEKLFKEMVTTKGKNGTGLGLFMSYSTIKANFNGQLSFESEIGKGTTFTISIPKISI